MQTQKGFTLIELISVIVILGILAAVALPKFVNLSAEARVAKMQGAVGSVNSAAALIHAKWLAQGSPSTGDITYEGGTVAAASMVFGYPSATQIATVAGLNATDYHVTSGGTPVVATIASDTSRGNCSFTYAPPTSAGGAPTVTTTNLLPDVAQGNCG